MHVPDSSMNTESRQPSFGLSDLAPTTTTTQKFQASQCSGVTDQRTRGERPAVYINNQWYTNVTVREPLCTEHVELLNVVLCPFYLPTEFNHFSITVVYASLLPLTSRSLMTR